MHFAQCSIDIMMLLTSVWMGAALARSVSSKSPRISGMEIVGLRLRSQVGACSLWELFGSRASLQSCLPSSVGSLCQLTILIQVQVGPH